MRTTARRTPLAPLCCGHLNASSLASSAACIQRDDEPVTMRCLGHRLPVTDEILHATATRLGRSAVICCLLPSPPWWAQSPLSQPRCHAVNSCVGRRSGLMMVEFFSPRQSGDCRSFCPTSCFAARFLLAVCTPRFDFLNIRLPGLRIWVDVLGTGRSSRPLRSILSCCRSHSSISIAQSITSPP